MSENELLPELVHLSPVNHHIFFVLIFTGIPHLSILIRLCHKSSDLKPCQLAPSKLLKMAPKVSNLLSSSPNLSASPEAGRAVGTYTSFPILSSSSNFLTNNSTLVGYWFPDSLPIVETTQCSSGSSPLFAASLGAASQICTSERPTCQGHPHTHVAVYRHLKPMGHPSLHRGRWPTQDFFCGFLCSRPISSIVGPHTWRSSKYEKKKKKEASHFRLVGDRFNKQGNLHARFILDDYKMNTAPHTPARI